MEKKSWVVPHHTIGLSGMGSARRYFLKGQVVRMAVGDGKYIQQATGGNRSQCAQRRLLSFFGNGVAFPQLFAPNPTPHHNPSATLWPVAHRCGNHPTIQPSKKPPLAPLLAGNETPPGVLQEMVSSALAITVFSNTASA
jgi:hypothetical protein